MTRIAGLLGSGLALALLAGCGSMSSLNPFADKSPKPPCPRLSVPADAASVIRFRPGPGEDLTDVLVDAKVADVKFSCEHDIDKETRDGELAFELTMLIEANRGPADTGRQASLEYFVTLLDKDRNVLQKKSFPVKVEFPGNFTRTTVTDMPVKMTVPLSSGQTGRDFLIYTGLQLSQTELDYNIRKRKMTSGR
ncbi:MAG: hypothetical protein H7841_02925 [Magnetospirillum sp. WYHS-4]